MTSRILIIGGYGVFGGRLARRLLKDARYDVLVAGRSIDRANAFCKAHGGTPYQIDLSADELKKVIAACAPVVVIDAAGPFQTYDNDTPYRLARAAIACGAHYLDLSDDGAFTQGISDLNAQALAANVCVLSGVSSVPALSSSIAASLIDDMVDIHHIESIILPGNKAPRGLSVIRAIVAQAGRPLKLWKNNQWTEVSGWSGRKQVALEIQGERALPKRWASYIGAPDLVLFPRFFKARSVAFRAGLDLKLMHGGLAFLSLPVRLGWLSSIAGLSPLLKWIADRLEFFGSDRGGMCVQVIGVTKTGVCETRSWTLLAEDGDGPFIPVIPAQILCDKLLIPDTPTGARPALNLFTRAEAETALSALRVKTQARHEVCGRLFQVALGDSFTALPLPLQHLHTVLYERRWLGEASVERGKGVLSRLIALFAGFPPESAKTPIEVLMTRTDKAEAWRRTFGSQVFCSYLSPAGPASTGLITERFGWLKFTIALAVKDGVLEYPVTAGTCFGIPLPKFLLPSSQSREYVDAQKRACFDVKISLPIAGHIVSYKGWLQECR